MVVGAIVACHAIANSEYREVRARETDSGC
jgi:hypothetical protein